MRCPFCGHIDSQVKDSRPTEDGAAIRRRRFCPSCGGRFTTFERVQLRELTVLKKSVWYAKRLQEAHPKSKLPSRYQPLIPRRVCKGEER